jgi:hypothetical protein
LEPRSWLVYYISRPLLGTWEEVKIMPAVLQVPGASAQISTRPRDFLPETGNAPQKREVKSFHDLLNHFPVIARQLQPGLENIFREFSLVFERRLPPPPSSTHIPDPEPDGPITAAMRKARSSRLTTDEGQTDGRAPSLRTENFYAEDGEEIMRVALETAVTTAIDLFQTVDKQQLSLIGATTELTGPVVERLIERYVAENVHHHLFPRLMAVKRPEDLELEAKIRLMEYIDVSQLGIKIQGGSRGKHELTITLGKAVEEFKRMGNAASPQEMMTLLLSTIKAVTDLTGTGSQDAEGNNPLVGPLLTVNADTLVSLLLFVVIRAQLRHLQARLIYIRNFIFVDDVDNGEMGYALSTFEAVLSYLDRDSASLRRASRRNKALWDAVTRGDVAALGNILEPSSNTGPDEADYNLAQQASRRSSISSAWTLSNGASSRRSSTVQSATDNFSVGSGLGHVFPFQGESEDAIVFSEAGILPKKAKRVSMDTRSMSSGSEISFRSRTTSIGTLSSGIEADTSVERLAQTRDSFGQSLLMMAVQHERPAALKYLLGLWQHYPVQVVLDDINHEDTTLFSAAVQLGHDELIAVLLDFLAVSGTDPARMKVYVSQQDIWGRSVAHYLFHAPFLIARLGPVMPWTQRDKNGQTPLFALCRSYDNPNYHGMVEQGLEMASLAQGDGQPLHGEEHVDGKGNTLLHIINDAELAARILRTCDVDVNAVNEKKFTPLMVASKYSRFGMVRVLFRDERVDVAARELRGLTAVELAKDDEVRNKIDDLSLFSMPSGPDSRTTAVVRSFFVEDASVKFVLKSGAPVDRVSYAVTTCRRSQTDFEHLAKLLAMEHPASWIPYIGGLRSPFQIPTKPSRAALRDLQVRVDWFLRILLAHPTFATHEMLWEFFLVPDLQPEMMEQRSRLKAEARVEKVRDEMEPLEDAREVEQFVNHARDLVRGVSHSTRSTARRINGVRVAEHGMLSLSSPLLKFGVGSLTWYRPP